MKSQIHADVVGDTFSNRLGEGFKDGQKSFYSLCGSGEMQPLISPTWKLKSRWYVSEKR